MRRVALPSPRSAMSPAYVACVFVELSPDATPHHSLEAAGQQSFCLPPSQE